MYAESFICYRNKLTSLKGAPMYAESFICYRNKLTSLVGAPQRVSGDFYCQYNNILSLDGLEFNFFKSIDLKNNPVYHLVRDWINSENRVDLIEYFVDLYVVQEGNKLSRMRLEAFYEDNNLEMNIDFNLIEKYYEIIY
jgi:hypothetical protein